MGRFLFALAIALAMARQRREKIEVLRGDEGERCVKMLRRVRVNAAL
jgi:hypothetical protein